MYKAIRYIGSKQKLLSFLDENLFYLLKTGDNFYDGFCGSGIVSQHIAENYPQVNISAGDLSIYSKILFNILNLGSVFETQESLLSLFKEFESLPLIEGDIFNEFSNKGVPSSYIESRNFFHTESGKTIDTFKYFIKRKISEKVITKEQADILLFFLLAYTCKVANTTSVFGAYLKGEAKHIALDYLFVKKILKELELIMNKKLKVDFYLGNIVENLKSIPYQDMIYLDPPYSTRRYETNYHILSFIVDLDFDTKILKKGSKTGQPQEVVKNSFASRKETENIFSSMIHESLKKCNVLGISYNTDGVLNQEWMENFCADNNYVLTTKELSYKRFKSKVDTKNDKELKEILWIIKKQ